MTDSIQTKEISSRLAGRIPGVDLLRGLCIIAVMMLHVNIRIPLKESALGQMLGKQQVALIVWNGNYGVIVFFVESTCWEA